MQNVHYRKYLYKVSSGVEFKRYFEIPSILQKKDTTITLSLVIETYIDFKVEK